MQKESGGKSAVLGRNKAVPGLDGSGGKELSFSATPGRENADRPETPIEEKKISVTRI